MIRMIIAAHPLIEHNSKVLITRRCPLNEYMPGHWDFPGGKLEIGETPEVALTRELKEETGLTVEIGKIQYVFANLTEIPEAEYFQLVYACTYTDGEVVLNPEEHDEYRWVTREELQKLPIIHFVEHWAHL